MRAHYVMHQTTRQLDINKAFPLGVRAHGVILLSECLQYSPEKSRHLRMPTGTKKSKSHSAKPRKKSDKKRLSKKRSASTTCTKPAVDILSPAAMENAYYISHNAVDCLEFRGFGWPEATKKKGKGLKKKTKKQK
ncbi:hypothetical protein PDJAM_G00092540 [Pangasius djambal]|uniref:Uncharacterized protein n=1 Tax=Pangasius djambal TaxID=1691987 RepID=A0ACC5Z5C3_9TELE|nr:hypothetical protein [Pangasius djambal]